MRESLALQAARNDSLSVLDDGAMLAGNGQGRALPRRSSVQASVRSGSVVSGRQPRHDTALRRASQSRRSTQRERMYQSVLVDHEGDEYLLGQDYGHGRKLSLMADNPLNTSATVRDSKALGIGIMNKIMPGSRRKTAVRHKDNRSNVFLHQSDSNLIERYS